MPTRGPAFAISGLAESDGANEARAPGGFKNARHWKVENQVVARCDSDRWGTDSDCDDRLKNGPQLEKFAAKFGDE